MRWTWTLIGMLLVLSSACGVDDTTQPIASTTTSIDSDVTTTEPTSTAILTSTTVDSQAIRDQYGFSLCHQRAMPGTTTEERGIEIIHASVDAEIAQGGSPGGDGRMARLGMFVLDNTSLHALSRIATPAEVCVYGQDPNDYVPLGPQRLEGPGWRWVGAGNVELANWVTLIDTQDAYDALWIDLGEGPETLQIPIDFDREVILAVTHGSGVNFGRCGHRFDGYQIEDGAVVINWFRPGGDAGCLTAYWAATYAVALDLDEVGPPPLDVAFRYGPRQRPRDHQTMTP